jgi:hypothetical protein
MSKGGKQTVTTQPDAATGAYQNQIRNAATDAGNHPPPGVDPMVARAGQFYGNAAQAGNLGLSAMNGDPSAIASYMNPYQHNVIDAAQSQFGDTLKMTDNAVADRATQAGAFGGSRYGVAMGVANRGAMKDQNQLLAGLDQQGYTDAMGRAGQAANLGFQGAQGMAGVGDYNRNVAIQSDPLNWKLQQLQAGNVGGGTTSTTTSQDGKNPLTGAIGGAKIGAGVGGPWGALIGAGAGGLLSMF